MPSAVHPILNPGVIVLAVGPPGRIDLARRNADRAKRIDIEDRLLAAAPLPGLQKARRRNGSAVARHIAALGSAGIVHRARQRCTAQCLLALFRQVSGNAVCELFPHRAELLVVDARQKYILEEVALRQCSYFRTLAVERKRRAKKGKQGLRRKVIAAEIALRKQRIVVAERRSLTACQRSRCGNARAVACPQRFAFFETCKEGSIYLPLRLRRRTPVFQVPLAVKALQHFPCRSHLFRRSIAPAVLAEAGKPHGDTLSTELHGALLVYLAGHVIRENPGLAVKRLDFFRRDTGARHKTKALCLLSEGGKRPCALQSGVCLTGSQNARNPEFLRCPKCLKRILTEIKAAVQGDRSAAAVLHEFGNTLAVQASVGFQHTEHKPIRPGRRKALCLRRELTALFLRIAEIAETRTQHDKERQRDPLSQF